MKRTNLARERQKSTVSTAMLLFNLVLVLLQLWLLVAVLENLIAGRTTMAIPAAIASAVILSINVWMLVGLQKLERQR